MNLTTSKAALAAQLKEMPIQELRESLAESLRLTADAMLRAAFIVRELEARGENLSGLRPMLPVLRKIAAEQVLPEVVVRFGGHRRLLSIVSNLPMEDQQKLAAGEPVPLIVHAEDGKRTQRMADPLEMRPEQISQAFAPDHLREPSEQHLLLDSKVAESKRKPERIGNLIAVDKERGGIVVARRHFIPQCDLEAALKGLRK